MTKQQLIRYAGLAALIGGTLYVLALGVMSNYLNWKYGADAPTSVISTTAVWQWMMLTVLVATILILFGVIGIYARQSEQGGMFSLVAFAVTVVCLVLFAAIVWVFAFAVPSLALAVPEYLNSDSPVGPIDTGFMISFLLYPIGYLLLALASWRVQALPRGALILLIVSSLGFYLSDFIQITFDIFSPLQGVALAWAGYSLWMEGQTKARRQPLPAIT